jgi:hypothetical protein
VHRRRPAQIAYTRLQIIIAVEWYAHRMNIGNGSSRVLVVSATMLLACSGRSSDAADDGMGSGTSGGSQSETADADGSGQGDDAGDSDGSCEPTTIAEPEEPTLSVVLENRGEHTIYVDGARGIEEPWCLGEIHPFTVEFVDTEENLRPEKGWCSSVCSSLGAWYFCEGGACPPECPEPPPPIRIEPGGSYTIAWSAVVYRAIQLPPQCVECEDEPVTLGCDVPEPLQDGIDYAFRAWAANAPDCSECDCEPDAAGSCVLEGWGIGVEGPLVSAETVTTGRPGTLTIAFE